MGDDTDEEDVENEQDIQNQKKVFVAGMGPGGLAAALEAAEKGYFVVIVEPRDEFTRTQTVGLTNESYNYLTSLANIDNEADRKFYLQKITSTGSPRQYFVNVNDLQKFYKSKLEEFPNVQILQGSQYKVTAIDPNTQIVTVKNGEESLSLRFDFIVAADGNRHEIVNLINRNLEPETQVIYQKHGIKPRQSASGTVSLHVAAKHGIKNRQGNMVRFGPEHLEKLHALGWDKPYFPQMAATLRDLGEDKDIKFFVSGEIPEKIAKMQDPNAQRLALIEWGKLAVNVHYGYKIDDIFFKEKEVKKDRQDDKRHLQKVEDVNKLKTTSFDVNLAYASRPIIELGEGGIVALIGDANQSANFCYGHGLNDALTEGVHFGRCLSAPEDNTFDKESFLEYQQDKIDTLRYLMNASKKNEPTISIQHKLNNDINATLALAQRILKSTQLNNFLEEMKALPSFKSGQEFEAELYYRYYALLGKTLDEMDAEFGHKAMKFSSKKGKKEVLFSNESEMLSIKKDLAELRKEVFSHMKNFYTVSNTSPDNQELPPQRPGTK